MSSWEWGSTFLISWGGGGIKFELWWVLSSFFGESGGHKN